MKKSLQPQLISVTGTKGKSTIVYILGQILSRTENILRVDTTGYYVNGEQKGTLESTRRVSRLVPTVCPGRFLVAMEDVAEFTAVLECSLGCSNPAGLGYKVHNVGVFTNVFEDHLGSTERLNSKADIANAKRFIFSRIHPEEGYAVFNADDEFVCSQLDAVKNSVSKVPCGINFSAFNLDKHLRAGGVAVTVENGKIVIKTAAASQEVINLKDITWSFGGEYEPSVYNLLFIVGALWARRGGKLEAGDIKALKESKLDPYGGRLTRLDSAKGVKIIADYAHEKFSLAAVGDLAKGLCDKDGKVIGVVRLAYDRTDELINDTAKYIAPHFNEFIVYDKIDGHIRKPKKTLGKFKMIVGHISQLFAAGLSKYNANVTRVVREDKAIKEAAKRAQTGDVVVIIVNDDIKRSIGFIKKYFEAYFV